jgi:hypothetical protein
MKFYAIIIAVVSMLFAGISQAADGKTKYVLGMSGVT